MKDEEPDLFDLAASEAAKAEGQARALHNGEKYSAVFFRAGDVIRAEGSPFTSEDIRRLAGEPKDYGAHSSTIGACMTSMAKRGLIKRTGERTKATAKSCHAAMIDYWVGT